MGASHVSTQYISRVVTGSHDSLCQVVHPLTALFVSVMYKQVIWLLICTSSERRNTLKISRPRDGFVMIAHNYWIRRSKRICSGCRIEVVFIVII